MPGSVATGWYMMYHGRPCLVTNNHVFGSEREASSATLQFAYNLNTIETRARPSEFFWTCRNLDATIVAIDNVPLTAAQIRPLEYLNGSDRAANVNTPVMIWGHPAGRPLEFSMRLFVQRDGDTFYYNSTSGPRCTSTSTVTRNGVTTT